MLRFEKLTMQGTTLKPESVFPALRSHIPGKQVTYFEEEDELFVNYGGYPNPLPYSMQDCYTTELKDVTFDSAVLENDYLKAVFLPGFGGRLWQLFDKVAKRDLITHNPIFKPQNFAIRNAWLAGGVEWNIGRCGHHDLTCSPMFTATTEDEDGTPVLRFYEFCRSRAVYYQIDFMLPETSKFLYVRVRIMNDTINVAPMYWWSNIAVPERKNQRIIVPAKKSFAHAYVESGQRAFTKIPVPHDGKFDITVPTNYPYAFDQFFDIKKESRKFEASIYEDGYGLIQTSTDRLRGRKLFVWGQGAGGHHWQRCLTSPEGEDYLEMQAGICRTQSECMPMPPQTAWEWLEAYGAIQTDPKKIFGDWDTAVEEVATNLDKMLPRKKLEEELARTKKTFALKPAKVVSQGAGWGALENKRFAAKWAKHLDFGETKEPQADWLFLLKNGFMPERDPKLPPPSYMVQDEWFDLLKKAVAGGDAANWHTLFQLGLNYFFRLDFERAEDLLRKSLAVANTPWAFYALGNLFRVTGRIHEAANTMAKAVFLYNTDETIIKETMKAYVEAGDYRNLAAFFEMLPAAMQQIPMCRLIYCKALVQTGRLDEAENVLMADGGLRVPDIQEGENSTSEIYISLQIAKAKKQGITLEAKDVKVPVMFDYRMS